MTPDDPNYPESPDGSQELASVLAEIAEIEARPGFEGPKIGRRLKLIRISASEVHGYESDEVFDDRVVGKISRACDALGYHWEGGRCDEPTGCIFGISRVAPGYDGDHPVQRHKYLIAEETGDSLALAAARAYLAAIQEIQE